MMAIARGTVWYTIPVLYVSTVARDIVYSILYIVRSVCTVLLTTVCGTEPYCSTAAVSHDNANFRDDIMLHSLICIQ